jgi:hypothetical protein
MRSTDERCTIAAEIVEQEGDYALVLKGNQGTQRNSQ